MSSEVSLTITRILNWTKTDHSVRLEIGFYGPSTGNYLAHKTSLGTCSGQTLLLNSSFKIHFSPDEPALTCKLALLLPNGTLEAMGSVEIGLALLAERSLLFVPFQDHDKVLEVKLYEQKRKSEEIGDGEEMKIKRESFLHQRLEFIEKLSAHEAELKKRFSEKVFTFLRELKVRAGTEGEEKRVSDQAKLYELDFQTRLSEDRLRIEARRPDVSNFPSASPNEQYCRVPPGKKRAAHELLIYSMKGKGEGHRRLENKAAFGGILETVSPRS